MTWFNQLYSSALTSSVQLLKLQHYYCKCNDHTEDVVDVNYQLKYRELILVIHNYDQRTNRTKMKPALKLSPLVTSTFMARRMLFMQEVQMSYKYIHGYVHV